jgi:hypothetical protein
VQHYYVNKQPLPNGDHEVHVPRCTYLPEGDEGIHLGTFNQCSEAIEAAKAHFDKVTGCKVCCNAGRTG